MRQQMPGPDDFKKYSLKIQDSFDGSEKEITLKTSPIEGIPFSELITMLRQYIVMCGFSGALAKRLVYLENEDLEKMEITEESLDILEFRD